MERSKSDEHLNVFFDTDVIINWLAKEVDLILTRDKDFQVILDGCEFEINTMDPESFLEKEYRKSLTEL